MQHHSAVQSGARNAEVKPHAQASSPAGREVTREVNRPVAAALHLGRASSSAARSAR